MLLDRPSLFDVFAFEDQQVNRFFDDLGLLSEDRFVDRLNYRGLPGGTYRA